MASANGQDYAADLSLVGVYKADYRAAAEDARLERSRARDGGEGGKGDHL